MPDGEPPLQLPARPAGLADAGVAAWREPVTIGTYLPEPPDRHPAYLDRRVYQGSSGRVYPLPFHDRISATREPVAWDGVHLENRWLRVLVLPELGGRIHVGHDRSAGYDFFYRNPVIKPALVGLAGPWIAGGVEFNWPQHHRPATFLPTDVEIEHEPDGAVTVWCSDHDPFARMKGMHGIRLHPDRAVIEVRARLYNRSEQTRTFLWWANVAARVHEHYQSFFPRDVRVVADHARRAVTAFPAADRPYYGVDYPARRPGGGDRLDWYRNIPVPTSYMCVGSREGFFGGYDHAARAGFVHVADPHIAIGKKQWTWGNAEFGHAWDRNLSDDGAAYVELMAGVFTDNQPDFSFIAPGETKVFSQVWYPIQEIGPVHAATADAAVRVDAEPGAVQVGVAVTAERPGCLLRVEDVAGAVLAEVSADIAPGGPHRSRIPLPVPERMVVRVLHEGAELVTWHSHVPAAAADAGPATEPAAPADVASVEELAVIGAHLEQYRHATRSPEPYWREALRRDPGHVASSVGLAGRAYRRGEHAVAEELLRAAVARLTALNANPADTAALYALGLVLERRGMPQEAYARYAAASWARAWRAPAGYRMARIDAAHGRDAAAVARLEDVLRTEPEHLQARALTALLLRRTGRPEESAALVRDTLALDPLDWWTRDLAGLPLTTDAQTCLDVALEYAGVGEPGAALRVLDAAAEREPARALGQTAAGPLIEYHRADLLDRAVSGYECSSTRIHSRPDAGRAARERARAMDATWCFPSRLDDVEVLERAVAADPTDARALALLGHWRYAAGRADDAVAAWLESAALDPSDAVVWRNLGLAAHNHLGDAEQARAAYDRALAAASGTDARLVFESDQLDARRGVAPQLRLESLLEARELVETRDDATVALAHLLLTAGRLGEARSLLLGRTFQPWEGGEGEVLRAWDRLCRLRSRRLTGAAAAAAIDEALDPPASLGEARHPLASTAALQLLRGDVLAAAGDGPGAAAAWERAAQDGDFRDMTADAHSEATFSSVLALRRLGRDGEARRRTDSLRTFVSALENAPTAVDYFATSLPSMLLFTEDPAVARRRRVAFLRAQLDVLDGAHRLATERLDALLAEDPHHIDALELAAHCARAGAVLGGEAGRKRGTSDRAPEEQDGAGKAREHAGAERRQMMMTPERLTITLWDFSWYVRTGPGEPFEDLDAAFAQAVERGYNTVRICAMPFLLFGSGLDTSALRLGALGGGYAQRVRWYDVGAPTTIDAREHLLELFRAARRHDCHVIVSSWEYQQSSAFAAEPAWWDALRAVAPAERPERLAEAHADLLDLLVAEGLDDRVAFTEIHNEVQIGHLTEGMERENAVVELRPSLEKAVDTFKARHPGRRCTVNYGGVPHASMRGIPENIDVLAVHPYVYGVLGALIEEFGMRGAVEDFPQEAAAAQLLRPGAPPVAEWTVPAEDRWRLDAMIIKAAEIYVHDWTEPAAFDRWLYDHYGEHRVAMDDKVRLWLDVAADWAADHGVPLVLGEGWVGYTPLYGTFEEGPVGAQICRDAVGYAREVGAWGTVVCSNAAPQHPMWADIALQQECNQRFSQ